MKRIFSRGLNFHGQCGLGKNIISSTEKFTELEVTLPIKNIETNLGSTFALDNNMKTVYYWGFNWDTRSFFRTAMFLNTVPNLMTLAKHIWPPLKSYPNSPTLLKTFESKIVDFSVGGGHGIFLDEEGCAYTIGENLAGQVGTQDLSPIYAPHKLGFMNKMNFVKISAGFQHSLFLTEEGEVYGCGKSDKLQLGEEYLKSYNSAKTLKEIGLGVQKLNLEIPKGEKIIDISAGKYHSALLMGEDGSIYANGDNSNAQVDGNLDNFLYYHCTPQKIRLPENSKVEKIYAKCNRSAVKLSNGNYYYWGGYSYNLDYPLNNQPKYVGFNLLNNETGIPEGSKIFDFALGLFHDILIIEN